MTFAQPANLRAVLNLSGDFSSGLDRATGSLGRFEGGLGRVGRGAGQLGAGIARVGAIAATAFVGGVVASVKLAADFEEQLQTINTIALATPDQLEAIGGGIRRLAVEHGGDLNDLTTAYYDLLSAGVAVADAQGVLNQATLLGIGTLGTTSQAVDVLTTALNAYQLGGSEAARISEELAVAVRDGKVTLDQIAPTYANVASIAATAGIGTDEIAAAFGRLTADGVDAAAVTTQMSRAIVELLAPSAELNALQEETGLNFAKIAEEQGLAQSLELMRQKAEELGIPFIDLFGRIEAYKFALATTGPKHAAFLAELEAVNAGAGTLAGQVGEREKGLAHQFDVLVASLKDAGITIGTALLPELTPLIADFATFLSDHAPDIKDFAEDFAGGIRDIVAEVKQVDFSGFLGALQIMAQVGGKVVDLFRSLPPDIQALAITGLALNKLSGGLLGAGLGNIAGGLIRMVIGTAHITAGTVTVVGGGVGATGGAAATGAGGIAGVLRTVLSVALFTGIATAIGEFLAQNVTRPADPQRFDFLGAAAASGNFPSGSQLGVPAALDFAEDLAQEVGLPLKSVQQKIVDSINIRGLTFDQAVAELRGETSTQTSQLTDEQIETRREIGAGFAASRTGAVTDATQTQQLLSNLGGVTRAGTSALTTRLSILEGLERGGQGILSTHGATLRGILAKPSEVSVYNTVNVSAPGVATVVNTYTRMRVGGVQADAP